MILLDCSVLTGGVHLWPLHCPLWYLLNLNICCDVFALLCPSGGLGPSLGSPSLADPCAPGNLRGEILSSNPSVPTSLNQLQLQVSVLAANEWLQELFTRKPWLPLKQFSRRRLYWTAGLTVPHLQRTPPREQTLPFVVCWTIRPGKGSHIFVNKPWSVN